MHGSAAVWLQAPQEFDSVYSSEDEEYRLLNPHYVLPEFVMLYRWGPHPPPPTTTATGILQACRSVC